jgi:hypothetical protein
VNVKSIPVEHDEARAVEQPVQIEQNHQINLNQLLVREQNLITRNKRHLKWYCETTEQRNYVPQKKKKNPMRNKQVIHRIHFTFHQP